MKLHLYIATLAASLFLLPCTAQKQHGKASFYSKRATGSRAASGKKIHHDSLTCAHRYYPFGTKLKVTNLKNDKSVIVEVIDRGPFGRGRIIDLSWAAAKEIGMIAQGIASVRVERLDNPIPYRPEEAKLPQIDFEVAETEFHFGQKWGESSKKKKKENTSNETFYHQEVNNKEANHKENYHKEMIHKEMIHKETIHKETIHKGAVHTETSRKDTHHIEK